MGRKLTMEEVRERVRKALPTVEIVSDVYVHSGAKLLCHCMVCGDDFSTTYDQLAKSHGCAQCAGNKRHTIEEVKNRIAKISPTVEIVSNTYKNNVTKLKCRCRICSHQFESSFTVLNMGIGCPRCSAKKFGEEKMLTLEIVKERLSIISPEIKIISTEYHGNDKHLECFCENCSTTFLATWANLSRSRRCPKCKILNMTGEKSHFWKGGITEIGHILRGKMTQWRQDSKKACGFKCVISGERFDHIHHIYGFDMILEETFDETGVEKREKLSDYSDHEVKTLEDVCLKLHYKYGLGACVTKENHENFHKAYKYGQNTPEQWEEFLEMKRSEKAS